MKRIRGERGTAPLEAALTTPILLLIAVGIFEFGRAYQTWQILTNAAREGARIAVLPNAATSAVEGRVRQYMQGGQLPKYLEATVTLNRNAAISINGQPVTASQVTVDYPFSFVVLRPVARLVDPQSGAGGSVTMRATSLMRNEAQ